MDSLIITPFCKNDIPSLVEIEKEAFSTPFKEKDFEMMLDSQIHQVLVAKIGEKIVGYISFTIIIDECQIINVAVAQNYRKMGIGKAILNALLSYGQEKGVIKYFLEVRVSNQSAIRLYEKLGFVKVGVSKNHFTLPREDGALMNLEL